MVGRKKFLLKGGKSAIQYRAPYLLCETGDKAKIVDGGQPQP
jgi:hypothetical protein